jgi:predicted metal-binding protein
MSMRWMEKGKKSSAEPMAATEAPADKGLVLICEKCGHNQHASVKDLKSELKHAVKEQHKKGAVRVLLTSCMSICPKDGIAVAVARTDAKPTEFFVVEGEAGPAAASILAKLA